MNDLISRKAVEKTIKEFFKTKIDEIPKREKFRLFNYEGGLTAKTRFYK